MSTRCQVKIQGLDTSYLVDPPSRAFTLYHHCDGYPENMLPLIGGAYQDVWQAGRVGKAAAMIVGADPLGFELEDGHHLHGDIEYYYVVNIIDGEWTIIAYQVSFPSSSVPYKTLIGTFTPSEAMTASDYIEKIED